MPLISIIFRALIIAPIRATIDTIKWLFTTVFPFLGTLLGSTPLNIIFFGSVVIMFLMWLRPDVVVWIMVLFWEINRFPTNIYWLASNIIQTLFYNWFAPVYNELVDFGVLVWTMVNNGICDGMPPFASSVDCLKFGDWLLIIDIWITSTYEFIYIGMGFLLLLAQLLVAMLGNLETFSFKKHNYCTMPACSDWGSMRIDPDSGSIIKNPGLFGVNFKDNLSEDDVRVAQIVAAILIFFIQWFLSEILPFLIQLSAWIIDIAKLVIYYLWTILRVLLEAIAALFGAAFYIMSRTFIDILNQPSLTIVFDPGFWNTSIAEFTSNNDTINEILDSFVEEYMFNITDLVQYRTIGIGRNETWEGFIRSYYWIHIGLQMIFELPLILSQLADKVTCLFLNLFQCLDLTVFCAYLFQSGEICLGLQKVATNNYLQSQTPDPWYYNYKDPVNIRIETLADCSHYGCNQTYCPTNAPDACMSALAESFRCFPSKGLQIEEDNFVCLDVGVGGGNPTTGPIWDPEDTFCWYDKPDGTTAQGNCIVTPYEPYYHSPINIPLAWLGGTEGVNFTYPFEEGCNITDVPGFNDSCRYCGNLFVTEASGIFYFSRAWFVAADLDFLYVAIDELNDLLIGVDLWAAIKELSIYMGGLCVEINSLIRDSGQCPCCGCSTAEGQFIKIIDEYIFKYIACEGYPCNPPVDDCCTKPPGHPLPDPYTSMLYTIRDIIDSFDIFNVLPDLF